MLQSNIERYELEEQGPSHKVLYAFFIFVILIEVGVFFMKTPDQLLMIDTDSYMRMVRVDMLANGGDWYDQFIHRSNAPFGEELQWSRAFDILVILLALPFSFFFDQHQALQWSGIIISPVLKMLSIPALFWAARAVLSKKNAFRVCVLFLCQAGLFAYYSFSRPDHHSLLFLLFIVFLGAALRILQTTSRFMPYLLGLVSGVSLWISVETICSIAFFLCFSLVYCVYRQEYRLLKSLVTYQMTLVVCLVGALLIERPISFFLLPVYDKLSIVHVFIVIVLLIQIVFLHYLFIIKPFCKYRFVVLLFLSFLSIFVVAFVFPAFFKGPLVQVDSKVIEVFVVHVSESQPLTFASIQKAAITILMMGSLLFALFDLLSRRKATNLCSQGQKLFLILFLGAFSILAFLHMYWSPYAEILCLFFMAPLLGEWLKKAKMLRSKLHTAISQGLILMLIAVGPGLLAILLLQLSPEKSLTDSFVEPLHEVNAMMAQLESPVTVLTDMNFGPQILYETPDNVIATPYHRNAGGILFLNEVMSCEDFDKVKNLLYSRQVGYVLIAPDSSEGQAFSVNPKSFYHSLVSGSIPSWLSPISLDLSVANVFRLYKVTIHDL